MARAVKESTQIRKQMESFIASNGVKEIDVSLLENQQYYTTEEAANFLGLTHGTVRWHISKGHLVPVPHDKIPQEVRRFLRKNAPIFTQEGLDQFVGTKRKVGRNWAKTP